MTLTNAPTPADTLTIGPETYTWAASSQNANATGTITIGNVPHYQDTVTIGSVTYIWQAASNAGTAMGTITFNAEPAYQDEITVGSTTYIWQASTATAATGTRPHQHTGRGGQSHCWQYDLYLGIVLHWRQSVCCDRQQRQPEYAQPGWRDRRIMRRQLMRSEHQRNGEHGRQRRHSHS